MSNKGYIEVVVEDTVPAKPRVDNVSTEIAKLNAEYRALAQAEINNRWWHGRDDMKYLRELSRIGGERQVIRNKIAVLEKSRAADDYHPASGHVFSGSNG